MIFYFQSYFTSKLLARLDILFACGNKDILLGLHLDDHNFQS